MRTVFAIFLSSFIVSLILTPIVGIIALKLKLVDIPSERKVHTTPMPRIGGVAICFAFFLSVIPCLFYRNDLVDQLLREQRIAYFAFGALIAFGLGLIDDIKNLNPITKLAFQIIAGIVAYAGGMRIEAIALPGFPVWSFGWMSLPVTIFWVVLVINAINLTDGLDGLAAGVSFFVCLVLLILCLLDERFTDALILSAMVGSILGFLRYNYNPASIFMGDSGSYFIGYSLAAVSMIGSFKGQAAVSILIPMIALGLPLMDTVWATIRRFLFGQKLFQPDRNHLHHRLLSLGLTQKRVAVIFYSITLLMATVAVYMVYSHDNRAAILLILVAGGAFMGIRKLGYLNFMDFSMVMRWGSDISDVLGISRNRRIFFSSQFAVSRAKNFDEFWSTVIEAVQLIGVDYIEIQMSEGNSINGREDYFWHLGDETKKPENLYLKNRLYMRLPLEHEGYYFGTLIISKDMLGSEHLKTRTLRRIEYLRYTMSAKLYEFKMTD